ncbi:MAG: hypothetical protein WCK39_03060 [Methanomassiliicoccales archaeon]
MVDTLTELIEIILREEGGKNTAQEVSHLVHISKHSIRGSNKGLMARAIPRHVRASKLIHSGKIRDVDPHHEERNRDTLVYWVEPA